MRKPEIPPKARTARLVVEELAGETLIYDLDTQRAHCLNGSSTLVWRAANGRRSLPEIAEHVGREIGAPPSTEQVSEALDELASVGLLDATPPRETPEFRRERRRLIRNLLFAPAILSILAPTVAQAASCFKAGLPCTLHFQCCTGICVPAGGGRGRCA